MAKENNVEGFRELTFYVNGTKVVERNPSPETLLVAYLREKLKLTGTKVGCGEGGCGSCTVMISKFCRNTGAIKHEARYACMTPICILHGTAVTTIEALGSTRISLHKLQDALVRGHGVQCGFCTPGMLMSMYALLRTNDMPSELDIETALKGNLCRCTGYRPILESFKTFVNNECPMGENCCQYKKETSASEEDSACSDKFCEEIATKKQELIFPSELQLTDEYDKQSLTFRSSGVTWHSPVSMGGVLDVKKSFPSADLVAGGNALVYKLTKSPHLPDVRTFVSLTRVEGFDQAELTREGISVGFNVTISSFESFLRNALNKKLSESRTSLLSSLLDVCQRFGSLQIRNTATLCGGLAQGTKGSDLNTFLLATDCDVTILTDAQERKVKVDGEFFSNEVAKRSNGVIIKLFIPFIDANMFYGFHKLSPRKDFSRASLNFGCSVGVDPTTGVVEKCCFSYGGSFSRPLIMTGLANLVRGRIWNKDLLSSCIEEIENNFDEFKGQGLLVGPNDHLDYILLSMRALFFKFFTRTLVKLAGVCPKLQPPDCGVVSTANWEIKNSNNVHLGTQVYNCGEAVGMIDDLGKPLPHQWANQSTTGEALFIDDHRHYQGELCLSLVASTRARARIIKVDFTEALKLPGVVGHVDRASVQGSNLVDEHVEIFASKEVFFVGQTIGAIVAETHEQARQACKMVQVEYEELEPVITVEDAIKKNSFWSEQFQLNKGDAQKAFGDCEGIVENEINIDGQEHFYMETHCCRIVPYVEDGGELEIFAGSQYTTIIQAIVAKVVGLPLNRINIHVKRLGGAFGGKELISWLTVAPCAVAAMKYNLPVRCMLTRREDMQVTGQRRPYKSEYKVGFTMDGKIKAVCLKNYSDDGYTPEWQFLMGTSILYSDSLYDFPNMSASGLCCKTNVAPCAAMRGAGAPQSIIITESIISDVAIYLGKPAHEIREMNIYKPGSLSLGNTPIEEHFYRCYNEVKIQSQFDKICREVEQFNRDNKYVKQAVALMPMKFSPHLPPIWCKASALVNIYQDGSVLLTHGGIESGQGINTKMIQVASRTLGISSSFIKTAETSTSVIPNATTTGGSTASDLNGMAVLDACQQIVKRLQPLRDSNPSMTWEELINKAVTEKVNLSAVGYWNLTHHEIFDWKTGRGRAHPYYTYAAIVSHVEVDALTGDHVILQVDIVMDVGKSINPAIDVGQIEGGFVMGLGLVTLEEHKYSAAGVLENIGPEKYLIPTVSNIPLKMNITLLKDSGNEKAVYSSKGIGEPPLLLSTSVWLAIKDAVAEARKEQHLDGTSDPKSRIFQFNTPATSKYVALLCSPKKLSC